MPKNDKVTQLTTYQIYLAFHLHDDESKTRNKEAAAKLGISPSVLKAEVQRRHTNCRELSNFTIEQAREKFGDQFEKIPERIPLSERTAEEIYHAICMSGSNYQAALLLNTDGSTLSKRFRGAGLSFEYTKKHLTLEQFSTSYKKAYPKASSIPFNHQHTTFLDNLNNFWNQKSAVLTEAQVVAEWMTNEPNANKDDDWEHVTIPSDIPEPEQAPTSPQDKKRRRDQGFWKEHNEEKLLKGLLDLDSFNSSI